MAEDGSDLGYSVVPGIFRRMVQRAAVDPSCDYALLIDEINRGNISKVFGGLVALLDKRMKWDPNGAEWVGGIMVKLPYTHPHADLEDTLDSDGKPRARESAVI